MSRYLTMGFIGLLVFIGAAMIVKEAQAMNSENDWGKEPTAIISCFGYGYHQLFSCSIS